MCFFRKLYPSQYKTEVERLTQDLITIGNREDFLSERPGGAFDQNCRNVRAREIGQRFFDLGGIELMENRLKRVAKKGGKVAASHLEACWRSIGGLF